MPFAPFLCPPDRNFTAFMSSFSKKDASADSPFEDHLLYPCFRPPCGPHSLPDPDFLSGPVKSRDHSLVSGIQIRKDKTIPALCLFLCPGQEGNECSGCMKQMFAASDKENLYRIVKRMYKTEAGSSCRICFSTVSSKSGRKPPP
jgi:hypothetical protein